MKEIETVEESLFSLVGAPISILLTTLAMTALCAFLLGVARVFRQKSCHFHCQLLLAISLLVLILGLTFRTHFKFQFYSAASATGHMTEALAAQMMMTTEAYLLLPLYVTSLSFSLFLLLKLLSAKNNRGGANTLL